MFENFMAFNDDPIRMTDCQGDAIYLIILNDNGYSDAIKWLNNSNETYKLSAKESSYYEWYGGVYEPLYGDSIPQELIDCFNKKKGV